MGRSHKITAEPCSGSGMVNFMCQLEYLDRPQYPDIWSNAILDVSVEVFLDEINI